MKNTLQRNNSLKVSVWLGTLMMAWRVLAVPVEISLDNAEATTRLDTPSFVNRVYNVTAGKLVVAHPRAVVNTTINVSSGAIVEFQGTTNVFTAGQLNGLGTIKIATDAQVVLAGEAAFAGTYSLSNGQLSLVQQPVDPIVALYRFENTGNPGEDGLGKGRDLTIVAKAETVSEAAWTTWWR